MTRQGNYKKPQAEKIQTTELCKYNCGQVAKYKFTNKVLCCSSNHNSCPGKRKQFSDRTDHKERNIKSLATRIKKGITKSSQIKGGETRRANGHYKKLKEKMQEHWENNPWNPNAKCPLTPYKDTTINYQGTHEYEFLESWELLNGIKWVIDNVKRGPNIWYIDPSDNAKRLYMSDFLIYNTIYEIKSLWTWNKHGKDLILEEKNKAKLAAAKSAGYDVILILNKEKADEGIMG
jgi:hypothetical protein